MIENREVAKAVYTSLREGRGGALVTLIQVRGSAYKRAGAMMFVDAEGKTTGLISGGCLENDVAEVAMQVLADGIPVIRQYAMDEDVVWGLGLGCPGTIELYIQPVTTDSSRVIYSWAESMLENRASVMFTLISEGKEFGQQILIHQDKEPTGTTQYLLKKESLMKWAYHKLSEQNPKSECDSIRLGKGQIVSTFANVYVPPIELIIFGAGHDAIPLAQLGHITGFKTVIVDPREAFNHVERFPYAERKLIHGDSLNTELLPISNRSYCVIMNHHIIRDEQALSFLLESEAAYIGVLGPLVRKNRILDNIKGQGKRVPKPKISRIHGPVGLDIGAYTPEEIAISIVAEILAVRNDHTGGFLREKSQIHQHSCNTVLQA
ncbi:XdhC family protein [Ammoniphilus sp. CFH 90114]|uniref:XdhC family protein n=1 Tax=Ammoniphilus sp. CFH 90114 TaxID=2493665 RepID=UPI00100F394D|nr:XdhC family protein [Ammoniphilus sp. CFH 90114]RXT06412.1 XdhC family protein [Ammoniphilus sp. CFH 90114]